MGSGGSWRIIANSVFASAVLAVPDIVTVAESIAQMAPGMSSWTFVMSFSQSLWHPKIKVLNLTQLPKHNYCAAKVILGLSCYLPPMGGSEHGTHLSLLASDLALLY